MKKLSEFPLITVVTVVFNGEDCLEETIKSVINQTYPNIEYIIIDGGSTDGTLNVIRKYESSIKYWVSERDQGIYCAMNKGIDAATGKWINFMNAGDVFFSNETVSALFDADNYTEEIIYGNTVVRYKEFSKFKKAGRLDHLWLGMQFCHQSAFVRTAYHKNNLFNITNKVAADFEFFYQSYINGIAFKYKDMTISSFAAGGVSDANRITTFLAYRDVICRSGCSMLINAVYLLLCVNAMINSWIKKILPGKITQKIIQKKSW